jgi:purine-binding chemotaxis protein CheW
MVATLAGPEQIYGILTVGEAQVALPLESLREVIPCPAQLITLPLSAPGLLGAVDLRGQVIPVLDLRVVLGMPAERSPEQVVVVVIHDGGVLGLLAAEVRGVTSTATEDLHEMTAIGSVELLFSHSFERREDASVVSVLDVGAICRLPGTPMIRETVAAEDDPGGPSGSTTEATRSLLLMRCGEVGLGIEIEYVHATLPHLDVHPSPLQHGVCQGVVDYDDAQVPVIDPLQLMGMGELPPDRSQGLVLRFEAGLVVLLLSEVIEIVQMPADELLALPPFVVRRPEFFRGVVHSPGLGDFLMLSSAALMGSEELRTLSTLNLRPEADANTRARSDDSQDWASSTTTDSGTAGGLYLTFSVAGDVAGPLEQIVEILPYPKDHASLGDPDGLVVGMLAHRDSIVPLVCLATLMGRDERPDPERSCVLLVQAGPGPVGLVVRSLGAIEHSVWEELEDDVSSQPEGGDPVAAALAKQRTIRTAPVGSTGSERMLSRIDLVAIAEALATGGFR